MLDTFPEMLDRIDARAFVRVEPAQRMLEFNEYLREAGYGVARLEVVKLERPRRGRRFQYDFLANMDDPEAWHVFIDPDRSAANIRNIVTDASSEGGTWRFLVWAEKVRPDEEGVYVDV
jgi:hypothetical protein